MRRTLRAPQAMLDALEYDPATGLFRWLHPTIKQAPGWFKGTKGVRKYRRISWKGRLYLAHRVAWRMRTGKWPRHEIDHRDCDQGNNRWLNLRAATHKQNQKNYPMRKYNKTGYRGVSLFAGDLFRATISHRGQKVSLGLFKTASAASVAYEKARRKYYGKFA